MLWQGERGPDGPKGDKGERGDDVSNGTPKNAREISFVIFDRLYYLNSYVCVCVRFRVNLEEMELAAKK